MPRSEDVRAGDALAGYAPDGGAMRNCPIGPRKIEQGFSDNFDLCGIEQPMKGTAGPDQDHVASKRRQRIAHGIDDILCETLGENGLALKFPAVGVFCHRHLHRAQRCTAAGCCGLGFRRGCLPLCHFGFQPGLAAPSHIIERLANGIAQTQGAGASHNASGRSHNAFELGDGQICQILGDFTDQSLFLADHCKWAAFRQGFQGRRRSQLP